MAALLIPFTGSGITDTMLCILHCDGGAIWLPTNIFVELAATLCSKLGCHVVIHFKRVGFELRVYLDI